MEALGILVAEFVAALVPLFILGLQFAATLLLGLLEASIWLVSGLSTARRPDWAQRLSDPGFKRARRVLRKVACAALVLVLLSCGGLLLVNYVFLDQTVAFLAQRAEARTGMQIHYESMRGDLFRGSFQFDGLHVRQESSETVRFAIRVDRVDIAFPFWKVLCGRKLLHVVEIDGVRGTFTRLQSRSTPEPGSAEDDTKREIRIKVGPKGNALRVERLRLTRAVIDVQDHAQATPTVYGVTIHRLDAEPLRPSMLWFDLLYRATIDASLDDTVIRVINRQQGGERFTHWSGSGVDARVLASLAGGPFSLFTSGTIDFIAEDTWCLHREAKIAMQWALTLTDVVAVVPPDTPSWLNPPTRVLADRINARTEPWNLGFTLHLTEGQFLGAATLDTRSIWSGTLEAFLKQSLQLNDVEIEELGRRAKAGASRFQDFIRRRDERRKASPDDGQP